MMALHLRLAIAAAAAVAVASQKAFTHAVGDQIDWVPVGTTGGGDCCGNMLLDTSLRAPANGKVVAVEMYAVRHDPVAIKFFRPVKANGGCGEPQGAGAGAAGFGARMVGQNYVKPDRTGRVLFHIPPASQVDVQVGDVLGWSNVHDWDAAPLFNKTFGGKGSIFFGSEQGGSVLAETAKPQGIGALFYQGGAKMNRRYAVRYYILETCKDGGTFPCSPAIPFTGVRVAPVQGESRCDYNNKPWFGRNAASGCFQVWYKENFSLYLDEDFAHLLSLEEISRFLTATILLEDVLQEQLGWELAASDANDHKNDIRRHFVTRGSGGTSQGGAGTGDTGTEYGAGYFHMTKEHGMWLQARPERIKIPNSGWFSTVLHETIHLWDFRGSLWLQGPDTAHSFTPGMEPYIQSVFGGFQFGGFTTPLSEAFHMRVTERAMLWRYMDAPTLGYDDYYSEEVKCKDHARSA